MGLTWRCGLGPSISEGGPYRLFTMWPCYRAKGALHYAGLCLAPIYKVNWGQVSLPFNHTRNRGRGTGRVEKGVYHRNGARESAGKCVLKAGFFVMLLKGSYPVPQLDIMEELE